METAIAGALIALLGALGGAVATHLLEKAARAETQAEQRRSREAQISTDAYALRRQLVSWLREIPGVTGDLERSRNWARKVTRHFDAAESRATQIAAAAADVSSGRAEAGRRAYVLFYEATWALNGAAAGDVLVFHDRQDPNKVYAREGAVDLVEQARTDLERCVAELEEAIDPALLDAETALFPESDQERLRTPGSAED